MAGSNTCDQRDRPNPKEPLETSPLLGSRNTTNLEDASSSTPPFIFRTRSEASDAASIFSSSMSAGLASEDHEEPLLRDQQPTKDTLLDPDRRTVLQIILVLLIGGYIDTNRIALR
jgi:hypothetical protein